MHQSIRIVNLVCASVVMLLTAITLVSEPEESSRPELWMHSAVLACWLVSAIGLANAHRIWCWVGSLLPVAALTISLGQVVLAIMTDVWSAQLGDRSVRLDPSTHGMPLISASFFGIGCLLLLVGLLALPGLRASKEAAAESKFGGGA